MIPIASNGSGPSTSSSRNGCSARTPEGTWLAGQTIDSSSLVRLHDLNPAPASAQLGIVLARSSRQIANRSGDTVSRGSTTGDALMVMIATARLVLVAALPRIARAEADHLPGWWRPLEVTDPLAWPPPLNDAGSLHWFASAIEGDPDGLGWYSWYVTERPAAPPSALIGNAGFLGRPDGGGSVEIGYSLLPAFQRRGFGTELVAGLVAWAFGHVQVQRVMAETYPELIASVRVLEKNGFAPASRAARPGAVRFELRRSVFETRRRHASGTL
jgi:ribosomal-protein-alanine N-acetyltransferase